MEYELNITDRVVLIQILSDAPKMGSYLYYKEFGKVAAAVSIPQEEQQAIGWKTEGDAVKWDGTKAQVKKVEIPECILKIVRDALKALDKQEKLRPEHLLVYEKFVVEEEPPADADL